MEILVCNFMAPIHSDLKLLVFKIGRMLPILAIYMNRNAELMVVVISSRTQYYFSPCSCTSSLSPPMYCLVCITKSCHHRLMSHVHQANPIDSCQSEMKRYGDLKNACF